ncbi:DUF4232 domain-containing protein [Streptomyces qinglanensis]|uniref:DUF4232 domain-containing protein n=1 Tax=Streptomyces qinglanensis TaxID=943816 RepID=UPI001EF9857E|nr:DUF4232 domain-containing protein [Streptomyces qinglanensis]
MREREQHAVRAARRAAGGGSGRPRGAGGARLAAGLAVGLAATLLTGCGEQAADAPKKVTGEAAPVPGDSSEDTSRKESASPSSSSRARDGDSKESEKEKSGSSGKSEGAGSSGGQGGSGGGAPETGACKTSGLAFSTSPGMAQGTLLVNLENTTATTCTMHGFPGVDLQSAAGSINADRNGLAAPTVRVSPGESTRFTLHYPPNDSGGSGLNVTSLVVTPPDETSSQTLPVSINLPVSDSTESGVTVGPVGAGK